ncbi:DUF2939 domain-containing protein [Bradyrhizobium sediminis]|uniref:DUF2939 domain-containing protein n=1 Tax=Bradyrhizobium sediminis TaxID=2840469 RepID=A0A975N9G8_9BRAD|nr:DUF2939 domain-containing protein [Bradyrhizobium sediminis]QWG10968.1 DUF2939 domain-containing protein [Bradyrhizobium sediminis]
MRWIVAVFAALLVLLLVYAGSAFVSLDRLVKAARAADIDEVMARTDLERTKRSLVDQIVGAYLKRLGEKRPVRPLERMVAHTYGASIADALVGKMLTKENLASLLQDGKVRGVDGVTDISLEPLKSIELSDLGHVIRRISLVKPVEFSIRLGDAEDAGGISLHFNGAGWQLSGIQLPARAAQTLAATLPVR